MKHLIYITQIYISPFLDKKGAIEQPINIDITKREQCKICNTPLYPIYNRNLHICQISVLLPALFSLLQLESDRIPSDASC